MARIARGPARLEKAGVMARAMDASRIRFGTLIMRAGTAPATAFGLAAAPGFAPPSINGGGVASGQATAPSATA